MKCKLLATATVLVAASLGGCMSQYNQPRTVSVRNNGNVFEAQGCTSGTSIVSLPDGTTIYTSPPENNGSLRVNYRGDNVRGRFDNGNGGGWTRQVGSTQPMRWVNRRR